MVIYIVIIYMVEAHVFSLTYSFTIQRPRKCQNNYAINGNLLMRIIDMSALNILVADSNQYMLKIVRAMLRGFSITNIREANDGAVALEELNTQLIDIVIVDYALETLNGVELVELLRGAEDSPNRFVPVIMLSAYTEKWRIETARDAGITEFLRKPLCARDLYLRIAETIERPRKFVRTNRYFGPDRRRHKSQSYSGVERRAQNKEDENLTNIEDTNNLVDELFG